MNQEFENENSQYTVSEFKSVGLVQFHFSEKEKAQTMRLFLSSFLPIVDDDYPKIENDIVIMTKDQYHFYRLTISQSRENLLSDLIPDHYFLKTLRADEFDYSQAFIKGLFPGEHGLRRQNLRPVERKPYIITPEGEVVQRANRRPRHDPSKKAQYSQIQSCTFIDNETQSRAFGFSQVREIRLYGLMTHVDDVLIHRGLIRDSGTVGRVFEHESEQSAKASHFHRESKGEKILYSQEEFEKFKRANLEVRSKERRTNEFLARLHFNPYRSVVAICTDTLEARLLAYHFAQELLKEVKEYASRHNIVINPNYRIPIIFYLPYFQKNHQSCKTDFCTTHGKYKHNIKVYTETMQKKDQEEALAILNTPPLKNTKYANLDCEFLLGLDQIISQDLLEEIFFGCSLAEQLLRQKRGRLLLRLLESRNTKTAEVTQQVFTKLLQEGRIEENDEIISELIKLEAFDIAEFIIKETNTDKRRLQYGDLSLDDWIIQFGNPRHMNFMGMKEMLLKASHQAKWVIIMLCLKEYPKIDITCLGLLLVRACHAKRYNEAHLLMQMGAVKSVHGKDAFEQLIADQQWSLASYLLSVNPNLDIDNFSRVLKNCIIGKAEDLVEKLINIGIRYDKSKFNDAIASSIQVALELAKIDMLQKIIAILKEIKKESGSFETLIRLAHDFADFSRNQDAIQWLEFTYPFVSTTSSSSSLFDIGQLFIETFAHHGKEFAEYRLRKYSAKALEKLIPYFQQLFGDFEDPLIQKFSEEFFGGLWKTSHKIARVRKREKEGLVLFSFKDESSAKFFNQLITRVLPGQDDLYPKIEKSVVSMTPDQYYFCHLYAMRETKHLDEERLRNQYVLKTFKMSDLSEVNNFISDILPSVKGCDKQNFSKQYKADLVDRKPLPSSVDRIPDSAIFSFGLLTHVEDSLIADSKDGFKQVNARFRFNPYRTIVVIGDDSFEAKFSAYAFAEALLAKYSEVAEGDHRKLNPEYKIPIFFYRPMLSTIFSRKKEVNSVAHDTLFYSKEYYQYDQRSARNIYEDVNSRQQRYVNRHYGFLLGLDEITSYTLFDKVDNVPLVICMIKNGFTWILSRFLQKTKQNLYEDIVEKLLSVGKHDLTFIICELILNDEFKIARMLLDRSSITIQQIKLSYYKNTRFFDYLIAYGTPSQLNFMGFENILTLVSFNKNWRLVRQTIYEYPDMDRALLSKLLEEATKQSASEEVKFLLLHGADASLRNLCNGAIVGAVQTKDWKTVAVFTQFPTDEQDNAEYGFALLQAVRNKEVDIALKLLDAGAKPFCREFKWGLESTLYYAVELGLNDLLPRLINFESQGEHSPAFYSRCLLARDLAYTTHNTQAAALFNKFIGHMPAVDSQNSLQSIARLFMQALYLENPDLAMYRLVRYLSECKLLDKDDRDPVKAISQILKFIDPPCHELPDIHLDKTRFNIIALILNVLMEYNGLHIFYPLYESDSMPKLFGSAIFYRVLLSRLNEDYFNSILELSKIIASDESRRKEWQKTLDEQFYAAIKSSKHSLAYCLVRLGAQPIDNHSDNLKGESSLEIAAFDGNEKVVEYLLSHFNFSQELKTKALHSAAKTGWITRIPTLLLDEGAQLTPEIVKLVSSHEEEFILPILDWVDDTAINSSEYQAEVYALWCSGFSRPRVQAKLSTLLISEWVIHYTLMHIFAIFELSFDDKRYLQLVASFRDRHPRSEHLFVLLCDRSIRDCNTIKCSIVDPSNLFENLSSIIHGYFSGQENVLSKLPDEKIILQTYQAVRSELEQIASSVKHVVSSTNIPFFKPVDNKNEFVACLRAYINRVDQLLAHKRTLQQDESAPNVIITELKSIPGIV